MSAVDVPAGIAAFLGAPTPQAWVDAAAAPAALPDLLVDHANCEKKAAATALSLMFRYDVRGDLVWRLSRIAREELRHFEQVQQVMQERGIAWRRVPASRYAQGLTAAARSGEPGRLVDRLIAAAFIEARSCERFALLAQRLDERLARFYTSLLAAEARHYRDYLKLARNAGGDVGERVDALRLIENELATAPDATLSFHSGAPPGVTAG